MLLTASDLRAGYGRLEILHGLDFTLDDGDFLAILGPNGAGKTTLLRTLSGVIRATTGKVHFAGRRVDGWDSSKRARAGLAYVPQESNVFDQLSVRDNLVLSASSHNSAKALDEVFGRFSFLADRAAQPAGVLSGGERQTLAVAMAVLAKPSLLLLDEPTAGLSPITAETLAAWILELGREGIAMAWVVEQDPETVLRAADRAYLMDGGHIRFDGTARDLLAREGLKFLFDMEGAATLPERSSR